MNQAEFNNLGLLLVRATALAVLGEISRRSFEDLHADGDLRVFSPTPESREKYYFKADVARIHGRLTLHTGWLEQLPEWISTGDFQQYSGLSRRALYEACDAGSLVHVRRQGHYRRFYKHDLEWFL